MKVAIEHEMTSDDISSLFGRLLVVVAHQDDETACSVLLQRTHEARVVFTTDGAPTPQFFWRHYRSRQEYAAVRHGEALQALSAIGLPEPTFLVDPASRVPFHDQELFQFLPSAMEELLALARRFKPDALLAPAYEGGHPDHDACSFLASEIGCALALPRWEMPLYHRPPAGELVHQEFRIALGDEIQLHPNPLELRRRDEMISKYVSQPDLRNYVSSNIERFRPQPKYDYSMPPHAGMLNYEAWGWPMTGTELCRAFQLCRARQDVVRGATREIYSWAGHALERSDIPLAQQS